jgi:hypothetical protein
MLKISEKNLYDPSSKDKTVIYPNLSNTFTSHIPERYFIPIDWVSMFFILLIAEQ